MIFIIFYIFNTILLLRESKWEKYVSNVGREQTSYRQKYSKIFAKHTNRVRVVCSEDHFNNY